MSNAMGWVISRTDLSHHRGPMADRAAICWIIWYIPNLDL